LQLLVLHDVLVVNVGDLAGLLQSLLKGRDHLKMGLPRREIGVHEHLFEELVIAQLGQLLLEESQVGGHACVQG